MKDISGSRDILVFKAFRKPVCDHSPTKYNNVHRFRPFSFSVLPSPVPVSKHILAWAPKYTGLTGVTKPRHVDAWPPNRGLPSLSLRPKTCGIGRSALDVSSTHGASEPRQRLPSPREHATDALGCRTSRALYRVVTPPPTRMIDAGI